MSKTEVSLKLNHSGALSILAAGVAKASEMKQPQCISVVDSGGHLVAFVRMDGAFYMSQETSVRKARTAACYGEPTGDLPEGIDLKLALADISDAAIVGLVRIGWVVGIAAIGES